MNSLKEIESFLKPKRLAFVGLSGNPKKFSRNAYKELKSKGFNIIPVNPNLKEIDGVPCVATIQDVPADVHHALFMTPKEQTLGEVKKAIDKGIRHIWIQQGADTDETAKLSELEGISLVNNKCILMFANPVGSVHRFHRFFVKLLGKYPN